MSQVFTTVARLWPTGEELDQGEDYNDVGVPATFNREAAQFATEPDGTTQHQFLFWNTGRHLTSKRKVKWIFTQTTWTVWTATRWYGTPGGTEPGVPRVRADAFSLAGDDPFAATPIDGAASSFVNGSGGQLAWPFNGDDHEIGTSFGAATVAAVDPLSSGGVDYFFAGWLKLVFGGDGSGTYVETDTTSDGDSAFGVFDPVPGATFTAARNTSADLVAAYGKPERKKLRPDLAAILAVIEATHLPGFESVFDPNPEDLVRLKLLAQLVEAARPAGGEAATTFEAMAANVKSMNAAQLKQAITRAKALLRRGEATVASLEVALKKARG